MIETILPILTKSEANLREHWTIKSRRVRLQRADVTLGLKLAAASQIPGQSVPLPCIVTLTRISPRSLDTDNLCGSLKACRDAVAAWLKSDDSVKAPITWLYQQATPKQLGLKDKYAVKIEILPDTSV